MKRSIFFELEYQSSMQLKHNLDVMHIEKNVCDSVLGTLLMNDKSKDTSNARVDLEKLKIRRTQWLRKAGNKFYKPQAKYSIMGPDRKIFCQFIKDVKLPDGFGSNISKKVTDNLTNITGLKSHDSHILMQRLIPIGVRRVLPKDTEGYVMEEALTFYSMYLRDVQTKFNRPERNEDVIVEKTKLWVFQSKCRPASATKIKLLTPTEQNNLEWFVLDSCAEVREYMK